ncbi:MAG TPA: hypothetical protein VJQ50_11105 [Terriglobales bacterium]|nr:hypothetical protein [Terriglobales bacterium]
MPHSATEEELRALFGSHANAEKVSLVTDRETGRSHGLAFVEMSDAGEADKAIAVLDGTQLGGRALKVNKARPKLERSFGSRGGCSHGSGRDDSRGHARQPRESRW